MADTPAGMKINFDEQNMTKWEVLMDGPDQSIYAVRQSFGCFTMCRTLNGY
jgi:ubiquitin-protein ligase